VIAMLATATPIAAQTFVRSVALSTVGGEAVVTIEANGPLPAPTMGALDGPPRVFLDFAGVRPRTAGVSRSADPRVKRVRVGLFSADPLVTRVVVDLVSQQPHRIALGTGRVQVFIGSAAPASAAAAPVAPARGAVAPPKPPANAEPKTAAPPPPAMESTPVGARIPPVPPLPPPMPDSAEPPARASSPNSSISGPRIPYRPPATPPPSKDIEKYRLLAGSVIDRLRLQMPLLEGMEKLDDDIPTRMPAAMEEFDRLREELSAIKPPDSMRAQHDMLLQGARLGSTAARLRIEAVQTGNLAMRRNGAAAAAGAELMLDRAFAELGLPPMDNR
jgi:hypothetical protein